MPLPTGIGYNPPGGGNADYGGVAEALSALQRNPQVRRASGVGVLNLTGSIIYGVWANSGTVTVADQSGTFLTSFSTPLVFDQGIPTANAADGGALTITPSNLSTVNLLVLYK